MKKAMWILVVGIIGASTIFSDTYKTPAAGMYRIMGSETNMTDLNTGASGNFPMDMTVIYNDENSDVYLTLWIDTNQDHQFDASEMQVNVCTITTTNVVLSTDDMDGFVSFFYSLDEDKFYYVMYGRKGVNYIRFEVYPEYAY